MRPPYPEALVLEFSGEIWYWRGPAPFFFVTVSEEAREELKFIANRVTYGWGMIPVRVTIGRTHYTTSLWPKEGSYVVPIKANVRKAESIDEGDLVHITLEVG